MEEFKKVAGGVLEVNREGIVRAVDRETVFNNRFGSKTVYHIKGGNIKPQHKNNSGYWCVCAQVNGIMKNYLVHRLVAEAFIPNPFNLPFINHKNENKDDNSVENLEWCTGEYNANYGHKNDSIKKKVIGISANGETVFFKSITEAEEVLNGNKKGTGISSCLIGKQKTAYGYKWRYA